MARTFYWTVFQWRNCGPYARPVSIMLQNLPIIMLFRIWLLAMLIFMLPKYKLCCRLWWKLIKRSHYLTTIQCICLIDQIGSLPICLCFPFPITYANPHNRLRPTYLMHIVTNQGPVSLTAEVTNITEPDFTREFHDDIIYVCHKQLNNLNSEPATTIIFVTCLMIPSYIHSNFYKHSVQSLVTNCNFEKLQLYSYVSG